jgi:hypothetical protein
VFQIYCDRWLRRRLAVEKKEAMKMKPAGGEELSSVSSSRLSQLVVASENIWEFFYNKLITFFRYNVVVYHVT